MVEEYEEDGVKITSLGYAKIPFSYFKTKLPSGIDYLFYDYMDYPYFEGVAIALESKSGALWVLDLHHQAESPFVELPYNCAFALNKIFEKCASIMKELYEKEMKEANKECGEIEI